VFEPWRKKSHDEIPRVDDDLIHEEDIDHEDLFVDPTHLKEAKNSHNVDLRKRDRRRKDDLEAGSAFMSSELDDAEKTDIDPTLESEAEVMAMYKNHTHPDSLSTETKPKNPDMKYLYQMIITVYFRDKAMKFENSLEGNSIHIEHELRMKEVDFQEIHHASNETLHIHCNDPEEREHIKHILL